MITQKSILILRAHHDYEVQKLFESHGAIKENIPVLHWPVLQFHLLLCMHIRKPKYNFLSLQVTDK